MDALDELLKPEGELRLLANKGFTTAPLDDVLMGAWGMDLKLLSDGTITLYDRPIELASASEKYRAGVLLAEMLGRKLGIGLLILDGLEILSPATRVPLQNRLEAWQQDFDTIILLATVHERPSANRPSCHVKGHKYWWVADGKVEAIN